MSGKEVVLLLICWEWLSDCRLDEPETGNWGASRQQRERSQHKLDRGKPSETMAAARGCGQHS
jgi:hypothetical protein